MASRFEFNLWESWALLATRPTASVPVARCEPCWSWGCASHGAAALCRRVKAADYMGFKGRAVAGLQVIVSLLALSKAVSDSDTGAASLHQIGQRRRNICQAESRAEGLVPSLLQLVTSVVGIPCASGLECPQMHSAAAVLFSVGVGRM